MNLNTIKRELSELKKDVEYYLGIEKVDLDNIPPMRYSEGQKPTVFKPFIQHGGKGSSRLLFKKR